MSKFVYICVCETYRTNIYIDKSYHAEGKGHKNNYFSFMFVHVESLTKRGYQIPVSKKSEF